MRQRLKKYRGWGLLFILIVTFLAYANTLTHSLVWDDKQFILEWQTPKLGRGGIWPLLVGDTPLGHEGVYRPVRGFFYIVSYAFWGEQPFFYHIQALGIHLLATALVYYILKRWIKRETGALIGALAFGIHPIHVESVTWITSSFDTWGQTVAFGAYAAFLTWRQNSGHAWYSLAVVLTGLAVFAHETASLIPLLILMTDVLLYHRSPHNLLVRWREYTPFFLWVMSYWLIRIPILHIVSRQPYPFHSPLMTAWLMSSVLVKYLISLVFPYSLAVNQVLKPGIHALYWADLNHDHPPSPPSFTDPGSLLSLFLLLLLIVLALRWKKKKPLLTLAIGWILLNLMPFMQAFPISSLYNERYAYPASLGISLLFALGITYLFQLRRKRLRRVGFLIVAALLGYYLVKTVLYNREWRDNFTLWQAAITKNPASNSNHTNLGNAYFEAGKLERAAALYQQAMTLNPTQAINYTNMGIVEQALNHKEAARKAFIKATELIPPSQLAHLYLGILYHQNQQFDEARKEYEIFRGLYPRYPDTYLYLGMLQHQQKQWNEAEAWYRQALALKPLYADAYNNWGNLWRDQGKTAEAIESYDKALSINPKHIFAAQNLSEVLKLQGTLASQSGQKSL